MTAVELDGEGIPVIANNNGKLDVLGRVTTIDETVELMASYAADWAGAVTVAVGTADDPSQPLASRLTAALDARSSVDQVVQYRVGPSIGAHMGPGTFGLFVFPTLTGGLRAT